MKEIYLVLGLLFLALYGWNRYKHHQNFFQRNGITPSNIQKIEIYEKNAVFSDDPGDLSSTTTVAKYKVLTGSELDAFITTLSTAKRTSMFKLANTQRFLLQFIYTNGSATFSLLQSESFYSFGPSGYMRAGSGKHEGWKTDALLF
jgi:hypothetical protein